MTEKNKNAFTIVELLVAMTLLVILMALSGVVFSTSVKAFRAAGATVDLTRNLRGITGQLSADFNGLQKEAPLFITFTYNDTTDEHYDMIHFFAAGDFQTTRQYYDGTTNKTVAGNIARIQYGHSNSSFGAGYMNHQILARKAHILTADLGIEDHNGGQYPDITNSTGMLDYSLFATSFGTYENTLEFDTITLSNWIDALNYLNAGSPDNANSFVNNCMIDAARPVINLNNASTLHLLMAQGIIQMQIQWAYTIEDLSYEAGYYDPILISDTSRYFEGVRWWPSTDPAGDGSVASDFDTMGYTFGVHFNLSAQPTGWFRVKPAAGESAADIATNRCRARAGYFRQDFYPKALKFTLRLKDGNGVFDEGKTFTHIVYLDE